MFAFDEFVTIGYQFELILSLISGVTIFLVGFYIFLKDSKRAINRLFFLMSIAAVFWGVDIIRGLISIKEDFWDNLVNFIAWIGVAPLASLFLHLSLFISEKEHILRKKIFLILLYFPSALALAIVGAYAFFSKLMPLTEQEFERAFDIFFGVYFESCLLISVFVLINRYISLKSAQERTKIRNFIIGALIPVVWGSIFFIMPSVIAGFFPGIRLYLEIIIPLQSIILLYFFFALGYLLVARGVLRYGLFVDYREILETVFKRLTELVIVTDKEGLILLTNERTLAKLNYTEEEILSKRIPNILGAEEGGWQRLQGKLKKQGEILGDKVIFQTSRGEYIPFLLTISQTKEGIIFVGRDIKELLSYQEKLKEEVEKRTKELKEAKNILEVKVKARTKELQELADSLEEQVKERTKELQKRVEELERFHKLTVGRELKMIELKREIERLRKERGEG